MTKYRDNIYTFIELAKDQKQTRHERVRHKMELDELKQRTEEALDHKIKEYNALKYAAIKSENDFSSHSRSISPIKPVHSVPGPKGKTIEIPTEHLADIPVDKQITKPIVHNDSMQRIMG